MAAPTAAAAEPQQPDPPAIAPVVPEPPARAKVLTIATWGGAYGEAQTAAVLAPFAKEQAMEVISVPALRDRLPEMADVVEVDAATLSEACANGTVVPIEPTALHPGSGGTDAKEDFLPGMLTRCGIGNLAWSAVMAINPKAFASRVPKTIADAFDTVRFPGLRAFVREPRHLLEAALLADGVDRSAVYATLDTEEGLARALGKLDGLFRDILWVDDAKAAMDAVEKGNAAVAQVFSGRAVLSAARGSGIGIVWDGQLYSVNYLAIPAGSTAKDEALEFVSFATAPERLAAFAQHLPYGPARLSALALADRHAVADIALEPYLPTSRENMARAVAFDAVWWKARGDRATVRFHAWLAEGEQTAKAREDRRGKPPLPAARPR